MKAKGTHMSFFCFVDMRRFSTCGAIASLDISLGGVAPRDSIYPLRGFDMRLRASAREDSGRIATLVADRQHILRLDRLLQGGASRSFGFTEMLAEQSVAFAIVSKLPWTNCLDYRMRAARAYIEFADRQTYRVRGANISTTNRTVGANIDLFRSFCRCD